MQDRQVGHVNHKKVEPYPLIIDAGECFMYLQWCETVMLDFVVLKEGGDDMCRRYSAAFGKGPHPSDFTRARLELGKLDFGDVKDRFVEYWPAVTQQPDVKDAIERVVLWRNALGHVNVQAFRAHLLYTPTERTLRRMEAVFRCHQCLDYLENCVCPEDEDAAEPISLAITRDVIDTIYNDITLVDLRCFYPVAALLDVEYRGVAWPVPGGGYVFKEHHRAGS